jgi:pantoate--beta-alanine ligase
LKTIRDINTLHEVLQGFRHDGETVALVPTMGSLHQGHMGLVRLAGEYAERVVTSVFVNPTQFGPHEDFENYPRRFDTDRRRLSRGGVDIMFAPTHDEVYPFGVDNLTKVSVPGLSTILCGEQRPGHFDGVTSVVNRLFNMIAPDVAVFGQKDFQQLVIIRRMVADLHMPIKILASPTFREKNGLALSSRNGYLTDDERERAGELQATICACRDRYLAGERDLGVLCKDGFKRLVDAGFDPEYLTIRKSGDLALPDEDSRFLVVLAAARMGETRLIDNVLFEIDGA